MPKLVTNDLARVELLALFVSKPHPQLPHGVTNGEDNAKIQLMIDINTLCEFSRNHCITICAFLVPANLLLTLQTMILAALRRSQVQIGWSAGLAILPAISLFFHVLSWFVIGVVMAPTYILFFLGSICLLINFWAVFSPETMSGFLRFPYIAIRSLRHPISG